MAQQDLIDASLQYTGQGSGATVTSNRERIQANFDELYDDLVVFALVKELTVTADASASVRIPVPVNFRPTAGHVTALTAASTAGAVTLDVTDGSTSILTAPADLKVINPGTTETVATAIDDEADTIAAGGILVATVTSDNGDLTGLSGATLTIIGQVVPA